MAPTADTYSKYLDRVRAKDPSVLLGSLCWYTVAEATTVNHSTLVNLLNKAGLNQYAPPIPRDDDVFRRVCTAHQRKRVETNDDGVFENYMMRDVTRSAGRVVKQIVVERVDSKGETLDHTASVQLEFTSGTAKNPEPSIRITPLTRPRNEQAMNLTVLIRRDFDADRGKVNAYGIREMFRAIVMGAGATVVRPTGGVYFLPEKQRTTVEALQALSGKIKGTSFHPVPLINDTEQTAMVRDALEAETRVEIEKRLDEIDRMLDGPEITPARYQVLVDHMNSVTAKTTEYAEVLDDKLAGCDLLVKSYNAKMRKLFMHVGDG